MGFIIKLFILYIFRYPGAYFLHLLHRNKTIDYYLNEYNSYSLSLLGGFVVGVLLFILVTIARWV